MPRLARSSIAFMCVFGATMLATSSCWAEKPDCRKNTDVQASADPDKNTGMCGHLAVHILGLPLPPSPNDTRDTKSVFLDKAQFLTVWQHYLDSTKIDPFACSTKNNGKVVDVSKLGMEEGKKGVTAIKGYSCTDKQCTNGHRKELDFAKVRFNFVLVTKDYKKSQNCKNDAANYWILVGAYPTN
jgi:hypothetical protein